MEPPRLRERERFKLVAVPPEPGPGEGEIDAEDAVFLAEADRRMGLAVKAPWGGEGGIGDAAPGVPRALRSGFRGLGLVPPTAGERAGLAALRRGRRRRGSARTGGGDLRVPGRARGLAAHAGDRHREHRTPRREELLHTPSIPRFTRPGLYLSSPVPCAPCALAVSLRSLVSALIDGQDEHRVCATNR